VKLIKGGLCLLSSSASVHSLGSKDSLLWLGAHPFMFSPSTLSPITIFFLMGMNFSYHKQSII